MFELLVPKSVPRENIYTFAKPEDLLSAYKNGDLVPNLVVSDQNMGEWKGDRLLSELDRIANRPGSRSPDGDLQRRPEADQQRGRP